MDIMMIHNRWLLEIVTDDKMWVSFFEPDGIENNKVWVEKMEKGHKNCIVPGVTSMFYMH